MRFQLTVLTPCAKSKEPNFAGGFFETALRFGIVT